MSHDGIFRIATMAVAAVVLPIGLYYRIRSQATREQLDSPAGSFREVRPR